MPESPSRRYGGDGSEDPSEVSRLRSQVAALESERDIRIKLEKLLEVQTVQVDLQKELRVKTESLLHVEQQATAKLRQQLDTLRMNPGPETQSRRNVEERFAQAHERIRILEQQLAEATAPETSDRAEAQLRVQLEEQERIIKNLQGQMQEKAPRAGQTHPESEVVRLQLLLQSRDKHLDEMAVNLRQAQNDAAEVRSEADVLRHQVRVMKKEVGERSDEMERQLSTERSLRAEVFQLQASVERVTENHREETRRASSFAETATLAEERQRRIVQLEQQLAEEQTTSQREREQLAAESEFRTQAKEQSIRHQTIMIESLTRELKEKQSEVERLMRLPPVDVIAENEANATGPLSARNRQDRGAAGGIVLPPLQPPSPRGGTGDDTQGQRSLESLHRQLRSKDSKIAKQTERLQTLTEMLEKRDQQLEELSTARRDREQMRLKVTEMEDVLKAQPRVVTHTEAERRLIEQEQRLRDQERRLRNADEEVQQERSQKEAFSRELELFRGHLADGASSSGALQEENARLSRELFEIRRLHDARVEELRRVRESQSEPVPSTEVEKLQTSFPALHRRLKKLEETDRNLGRDVAVHLQERENRIENLNSTIALLRSSIEDMRQNVATAPAATEAGVTPAAERAAASSANVSPSAGSGGPRWGWRTPEQQDSLRPSSAQHVARQRTPLSTAARDTALPLGQDAQVHGDSRSALAIPRDAAGPVPVAHPTGMPIVTEGMLTTEDIRTLSAEEIRHELLARRQEAANLENQLQEKQVLVMRLIEEANLCNAEVASLQQTVQQAYKDSRKQVREFEALQSEKKELERVAQHLQKELTDKDANLASLLNEHQQDTSGNAAVDEVDRSVGWKLKVLPPRQHEIRHSLFLVMNRRIDDTLVRSTLSNGLAHYFAISAGRVEIVEDARLSDGSDTAAFAGIRDEAQNTSSHEASEDRFSPPPFESPSGVSRGSLQGLDELADAETDHAAQMTRDLVLVSIKDKEVDQDGIVRQSVISALDVMNQIRNDMLRGKRMSPMERIFVDAVFINHGDMVLPYEWPSAQSKLLLREGRILAGKHSVVTVHEVLDPYILRIVAYDTEVGREFILYLHSRDVLLLLDTRDAEGAAIDSGLKHLEGPLATEFRATGSVADARLLDVIISSLSFSVWQDVQILVASEMRVPLPSSGEDGNLSDVLLGTPALTDQVERSIGAAMEIRTGSTNGIVVQGSVEQVEPSPIAGDGMIQTLQPALLSDVGLTRGFRPPSRNVKLLYEDVMGFEGRICIFSLVHVTTSDMSEDILTAKVYYPRTCKHVEACLTQPMISDRLRIVAEAGAIDEDDVFCVALVVEEIIYPPAFLVRLTSVSLQDAYILSPGEEAKPHSHVIRVTKDGSCAHHLPDISFAVSPSTMRTKLLRCIGFQSSIEAPREKLLKMPRLTSIVSSDHHKKLPRRAVMGHVQDAGGLRIQVDCVGGSNLGSSRATGNASVPKPGETTAAVRANLRAKYGKGRLLVRQGRMVAMRSPAYKSASTRCVVSVYERPQPYPHFLLAAYEPQTSREWEVLADSIDVFKLFVDRNEPKSSALDLANPSTRQMIAEALVVCVELADTQDEIVLVVSPEAIRAHIAKTRAEAALTDKANIALGGGKMLPIQDSAIEQRPTTRLGPNEPFQVVPAVSHTRVSAIGGFTGGFADRGSQLPVEHRLSDRLFSGQRRLMTSSRGSGEPFKVQIYDAPVATSLHSYLVIATPVQQSPLLSQSLPVLMHEPGDPSVSSSRSVERPERLAEKPMNYMLKIDDTALEHFLWDSKLLEPSRQEELLHYISQSLHLDEDRTGQLRLYLRKNKIRVDQIKDARAEIGEKGAVAPAANACSMQHRPEGAHLREIGGCFPLQRMKVGNKNSGLSAQGPSLRGSGNDRSIGGVFLRDWKKVYCMAQRFGQATVVITVSRRDRCYRLSVYEPETSALYEMCLVTSVSSTPTNILMERCDLAGKIDIVLVMAETSFPHQVAVHILLVGSTQEFNLKIGDDLVYTMLENSRRDAFMLFFDQLIAWGCIGFQATLGKEEEVIANVWEETFAGNQIFDRTQIEDVLESHLVATVESGEYKAPVALAPGPQKKLRVPVIRTQLDLLGKKPPPTTALMQLLYHGEHLLQGLKQTVLIRVHRKSDSNDIAITLRTRTSEGLSLPQMPRRLYAAAQTGSANGRPFSMPAMSAGESSGVAAMETTIWLQDKCARTPWGAYGEICEIPGIDRQFLVLITDEDMPRAVRIAVVLAQVPFTVLFQVVLLETSEASAKVEPSARASTRRVFQQVFHKHFGFKGTHSSAAHNNLTATAAVHRDRDLRAKLDEISATDRPLEHLGIEYGDGPGGPKDAKRQGEIDESVDTAIVNMCTRQKIGRMMVFTIYRDLIANNMYLRVVMHDPVAQRDSHLTLLHYTTQRLLLILRINRDMLEECRGVEDDATKQDRQTLRSEMGKLIVDHVYLIRASQKDGLGEPIDHMHFSDDEQIDYELRMRDIMVPSNAAAFTSNRRFMDEEPELSTSRSVNAGTEASPQSLMHLPEEHLIHKVEKNVNGRRVLVAFYNETTKEDVLMYSHNIRVVVACILTLDVLLTRDFHEAALELTCSRRDKRHLMSATRELDLVKELADCIVLQAAGQRITDMVFAGMD